MRVAAVHVEVSYRDGEFQVTESFRHPVVVHALNAISWKDKRSIASFVDPQAKEIIAIRDAAERAVPAKQKASPLALPVALFGAMQGLAYAGDPVNPYQAQDVDYVQFPLQTLARGRGDCDDLAVVYASLLEASGKRSMLLFTPGHVMVAVETEIPIYAAANFVPDGFQHLTVEGSGSLWIPVETTAVGKPFRKAWSEASDELERAARAGGRVSVLTRDAWRSYPSLQLPSPTRIRMPRLEGAKLASQVRALVPTNPGCAALASAQVVPEEKIDEALQCLVRAGETARARALLEKHQKSADRRVQLGNIDFIEGKFDAALSRYRRVLRRESGHASACMNAYMILRLRNDERANALIACLDGRFVDYIARNPLEKLAASYERRLTLPVWP